MRQKKEDTQKHRDKIKDINMPYMWAWFGDKAKKALDRACKQFTWEHDI